MRVCRHCLMAIESREGSLANKRLEWIDVPDDPDVLYVDDNGEEFVRCEWCDEWIPIYEMYLI